MSLPTKPRISVCIANFNGADYLNECLASVFAQASDEFELEVIVHDDASTDNSLSRAYKDFSSIIPLYADTNVGFAVSNNRMVARSTGNYILLLNNDAKLAQGALAELLSYAESVASPTILTLPQYDWETGLPVDRGMLLDIFNTPLPNLDPSISDVAFVIGACLWIPKSLWNELGGFPPIFESIAEDMFLCSAARANGYSVQTLSSTSPGYFHRQGASFGGNKLQDGRVVTTLRRRKLSERNRAWVALSCTPSPWTWPYFLALMIIMPIEGIAVSVICRSVRPLRDIYWPAFKDAIKGIPAILALRKRMKFDQGKRDRYFSTFRFRATKFSLLLFRGPPHLD